MRCVTLGRLASFLVPGTGLASQSKTRLPATTEHARQDHLTGTRPQLCYATIQKRFV